MSQVSYHSEDSQDQPLSIFNQEDIPLLKGFPCIEIIEYCKSKYPEEACGLVIIFKGKYKWIPCENVAYDKKLFFAISPLDFANAEDMGKVSCVVHSHTNGNTNFTESDMDYQSSQGIPWMLCVVNGDDEEPEIKWLCKPKKELPLFGREYIWHISDCFSFVRDWYKQELGIVIPDFYRQENFWEKGQELYLDNLDSAGFVRDIPFRDIRYGDVILFKLTGTAITTHAGVYVGGNRIAHHLKGRLSSYDILGQYYKDKISTIVRHRSRVDENN